MFVSTSCIIGGEEHCRLSTRRRNHGILRRRVADVCIDLLAVLMRRIDGWDLECFSRHVWERTIAGRQASFPVLLYNVPPWRLQQLSRGSSDVSFLICRVSTGWIYPFCTFQFVPAKASCGRGGRDSEQQHFTILTFCVYKTPTDCFLSWCA